MMFSAMKRSQQVIPFRRCFSTMSVSDLAGVKSNDVISSGDTKWVASYMQAAVQSGDSTGAHGENLNEYFRKNFRKLSSTQAMDFINSLDKVTEPAACLDKFWIWESLEEAIRGEMDTINEDDFKTTKKVFCGQYKGSSDMIDMMEYRIYASKEFSM